MLNRTTLGTTLTIAALALGAPSAFAGQPYLDTSLTVCNEATPVSLGGAYDATDGDPLPPARFQQRLFEHRGQGRGLINAAAKSPALSICGLDGGGDGEDGGDDDDGGVN